VCELTKISGTVTLAICVKEQMSEYDDRKWLAEARCNVFPAAAQTVQLRQDCVVESAPRGDNMVLADNAVINVCDAFGNIVEAFKGALSCHVVDQTTQQTATHIKIESSEPSLAIEFVCHVDNRVCASTIGSNLVC